MKIDKSNIQFQGVGFALTATGLLKILWNKLFPQLFGWKKITYWQSVMLYLICKALFDFKYTIRDSFNFGYNNINGENIDKKKAGKATPTPAEPCKEEAPDVQVKVDEEKGYEFVNDQKEEKEPREEEKEEVVENKEVK